jgi:hypothetical protein
MYGDTLCEYFVKNINHMQCVLQIYEVEHNNFTFNEGQRRNITFIIEQNLAINLA